MKLQPGRSAESGIIRGALEILHVTVRVSFIDLPSVVALKKISLFPDNCIMRRYTAVNHNDRALFLLADKKYLPAGIKLLNMYHPLLIIVHDSTIHE
jgi:hypothetical protein